ncbi:Core-2/I-Branching enzyme [compost metagenome]
MMNTTDTDGAHSTYLILSHKIPSQTARLIDALNHPNTVFVIHVDGSVPLDSYIECFRGQDNVYIMTERTTSGWGSFGLVEACLNGLKYITENIPTKRVTLMSGQDYPIKSGRYISAYFNSNTEAIFINYCKLPNIKRAGGGLWRFPNIPRPMSAKTLYSGSQWWSFPIKTAVFILQYLKEEPGFMDYFQYVYIPDESFFQTLLLNCDNDAVSKNIVNNSLKLIKWDPPYMHPRLLSLADRNIVLKSKNLFARKFDPIESKELLDFIDSCISSKRSSILPKENKRKQAILYMINHTDENLLSKYHELLWQAESFGEVKLLVYKTDERQIKHEINCIIPFVFTNSILTDMGYFPFGETLSPSNKHFPLFKFYVKNPDCDYYWIINDQVRPPQGWDNFFDPLMEETGDFLSCNLKEFSEDPTWYGWQNISYKQRTVPDGIKVRSFSSIYRISNSAMEFLHHCLSNGWIGHHEVLVPTLLKKGGFSIVDMTENGHCFQFVN